MRKVLYAVAALLAVLALGYLSLRLREGDAVRRMHRTLDGAEASLAPRVFTHDPDYDRDAASLLVQARWLKYTLNALTAGRKPLAAHVRLVANYADNLTRFERGEDVLSLQRGVFLKGYRSDLDNSLRPYSICVPAGYDGSRAWPLVVSLHGLGGLVPFQGHPAPVMTGAIVLSPEGRAASDYMWIGEDDVLRAMDEVKHDYRIDERRVFITGTSMGGTGAWNVAARNPRLFAGVGPRAANCDFRAWETRWGWNPPLTGQHEDLRRWLLESDSPVTFIGNLATTPVSVLHNAGDAVVPVEHARSAVERLRALGGVVEYREYLVGTHGSFTEPMIADQLAWLAGQARPEPPRKFRFETRDARHGRTWYAEIVQLNEVMKPATLDVCVDAGGLDIRTANVLALIVYPEELPLPADDVSTMRTLRLDGQAFPLALAGDVEPRYFVRAAGAWKCVETWPPDDSLRKIKGLEGPVEDVFREPFVVVVGSGGGEAWYRAAGTEAWRFVIAWAKRFGGAPTLVSDVGLTTEQIASRNLAFFGRPADHSRMKRILDDMPVRIADDGVAVAGERFAGDDVGAVWCYPTPGFPGRMTAVYSAASPAALYQVHARFDNWFNWGIYDSRKWFDYAVFDSRTIDPETYRVVGFFGTDWSLARGRSWRPTPEALARVKPHGVPRFAAPPDDNVVYLSDLQPAVIEQMRGAVGFDRSFHGHVIALGELKFERGLGVRCPSLLEFPLDGKYRRFRAIAGFTDEPEETLSTARREAERADVVVLGDGRELFRRTLDWIERPSADVDVDVKAVRKLTLLVERRGGALWLHGSSAWVDARVER